jgi:putative transcriptional regulator
MELLQLMMDESILDVVQESAEDLHDAGVMDEVTMREFDELCLTPVKVYTAKQIQQIRKRNKASQGVFAVYLNTTKSTVQKWEQGQKTPSGPSLKLLNIVDRKGLEVLA